MRGLEKGRKGLKMISRCFLGDKSSSECKREREMEMSRVHKEGGKRFREVVNMLYIAVVNYYNESYTKTTETCAFDKNKITLTDKYENLMMRVPQQHRN